MGLRRRKDPNEPKKPLSAYLIYSNHVRGRIVAKFPGLKVGEVCSVPFSLPATPLVRPWRLTLSPHDRLPVGGTEDCGRMGSADGR